jgi:nitroreductase
MNVLEAVRSRRSIKPEDMRTDPIPEEVLEEILEAGNWAPSHGHTEPWRFVLVPAAARDALVGAISCGMSGNDRPLDPADPRRSKLAAKMATAPVVIGIGCSPSQAAGIVEHEEIAATAMAIQNMHLVARSHGLGGFWSSGNKAFHPAVAQCLGFVAPARCLGFFYLGYPAIEWPEGHRRPVGEKVRSLSF